MSQGMLKQYPVGDAHATSTSVRYRFTYIKWEPIKGLLILIVQPTSPQTFGEEFR